MLKSRILNAKLKSLPLDLKNLKSPKDSVSEESQSLADDMQSL